MFRLRVSNLFPNLIIKIVPKPVWIPMRYPMRPWVFSNQTPSRFPLVFYSTYTTRGVQNRISEKSDIRISDIRNFRILDFTIRIRIRNFGYGFG
ncbi:hypothetical protein HanPI659440_Chr03g0137331 [Helianthus annuus]|nr:hypothetical protein HanPI659440_Chr03g0137331 [Helianthus annuus]